VNFAAGLRLPPTPLVQALRFLQNFEIRHFRFSL
jgi:hypothetical protein